MIYGTSHYQDMTRSINNNMKDDDQKLLWEAYLKDSLATPRNIERVKGQLSDPDLSSDDRELVVSMLKTLQQEIGQSDRGTVKSKVQEILNKLSRSPVREGLRDAMAEQEQFDDIAYKYNGMSEEQLKAHEYVIGELLEMDPMERAEQTGDGPQYDRSAEDYPERKTGIQDYHNIREDDSE